jgi:hypothetical protein
LVALIILGRLVAAHEYLCVFVRSHSPEAATTCVIQDTGNPPACGDVSLAGIHLNPTTATRATSQKPPAAANGLRRPDCFCSAPVAPPLSV